MSDASRVNASAYRSMPARPTRRRPPWASLPWLDAVRLACVLPTLAVAMLLVPAFGLAGFGFACLFGAYLWIFAHAKLSPSGKIRGRHAAIVLVGCTTLAIAFATVVARARPDHLLDGYPFGSPSYSPVQVAATVLPTTVLVLTLMALLFISVWVFVVRARSRRPTFEDADRVLLGIAACALVGAVYSPLCGATYPLGVFIGFALVCFAVGGFRSMARRRWLARVARGELPSWTIWSGVVRSEVAAELPSIFRRSGAVPDRWLLYIGESDAETHAVASVGLRP